MAIPGTQYIKGPPPKRIPGTQYIKGNTMNKPKPYWIIMELEPDPDKETPQLKDIGGAHAELWVFESLEQKAIEKAIRYIQSYGWRQKKLVHALQPSAERIAQLDTHTTKNYQHAEQLGINAHFLAWPKSGRPGHFSVESLKKPPKKSHK